MIESSCLPLETKVTKRRLRNKVCLQVVHPMTVFFYVNNAIILWIHQEVNPLIKSEPVSYNLLPEYMYHFGTIFQHMRYLDGTSFSDNDNDTQHLCCLIFIDLRHHVSNDSFYDTYEFLSCTKIVHLIFI